MESKKFEIKKILGLKKINSGQKNLRSKNFRPKKLWGQKNLGSKKFGVKKIWGPKKFWVKNISG